MIKLTVKSLLMLLVMAGLFAALWVAPGRYTHDLAAIVNKREMLTTSRPPRIIFMGGSSLLSLDSPSIERATGRQVINMGLWGGLSLRSYVEEIKDDLRPGDTVVITQEYSTVMDRDYVTFINTNEESKKFLMLLSPGRHLTRYCRQGRWFEAFTLMMQLVQMKNKALIQNLLTLKWEKIATNGYIYYEEEFNACGDRVRPFKILRPLDSAGIRFSPPDMRNHLYLNDVYRFAQQRGVKLLYYFSHFPEKEFRANQKVIAALHEQLRANLRMPIINTPEDMMFPEDHFADTVYHLNTKGEAVRTKKIIQYLKRYL